ncbi:MAG TPA: efflux RND transporter periplasmic adaptor subunit [Gemmatimonadaceae bacterium]|nr:efflux RND transporter periplasmic adaptor subunit [Gemmatimonadaceae bacterium]
MTNFAFPPMLRRSATRVALTGACALLGACNDTAPREATGTAAVTVAAVRDTALLTASALTSSGVEVQAAQRRPWRESWQLPAHLVLDPTTTQTLGSIVEGRVTQVFAQPGERVRRGQVLVTIHTHELTAALNALAQAKAGNAEAEANAQVADAAAARSERLYTAQAGSLADVERARAAKVAADEGKRRAAAEYHRAAEMVEHLRPSGQVNRTIDPEDMLVRAPFDGVVVSRETQPGAVVTPGAILVTVSRTNSVLLVMHVPEQALGAAKVGAEVQFTVPAYPGRSFTARVARVAPALDSLSRTAEVFATVDNRSGELRGEMSASSQLFGLAGDSVLVVPGAAVQDFEGDTVVITGIERDGTMLLEAVRVRIGRRAAGVAEVRAGLAVGAPVINAGASIAKAELLRQRDARNAVPE